MSLINDALKRAKESGPSASTPSQARVEMKPVATKSASLWPLLMLPVVLVTIFALAVFLILKVLQKETRTSIPAAPTPARTTDASGPDATIPVAARENPALNSSDPKTDLGSGNSQGKNPAETPVELVPAENSSLSATEENESPTSEPVLVAAPAPEPEPTFPALRLQGIFYRKSNASVIINSETLFLGDLIEEAKVLKISKTSVTLQWRDETKELTLR